MSELSVLPILGHNMLIIKIFSVVLLLAADTNYFFIFVDAIVIGHEGLIHFQQLTL